MNKRQRGIINIWAFFVALAVVIAASAVSYGSVHALGGNDRQFDPGTRFSFKVEIEGVTQGAFSAVSGIESETEIIEFADGDDPLHIRKIPGRTKYANIVLRRNYTGTDELWQWYRAVIQGAVERRSGSIIIADRGGQEVLRYNFFEAWPVRYKNLSLDAADGSTALTEEIEIAVEVIEQG